jgi:SAM-dependent methyltransferase
MDEYFIRRPPQKPIDYEEAYWGRVTDPDGKERTRADERGQYLDDLRQELEFLNGLAPGRVCDVGCGLGFLLSALREGWRKYGVEVSTYAARQAQEWANVHVGPLQEAGYPDGYFDLVVMYHVIEHMADPLSAIREVCRILRPGGVLLFATPDFDSGCARRFKQNYRLLHDPTHISLFTNDSAHRFLRDHGFVIDRVEYPFFETRHFTPENLMRLFDTSVISPPFYGNFMSFYCHKPVSADGR